jgi:hypothetical protein
VKKLALIFLSAAALATTARAQEKSADLVDVALARIGDGAPIYVSARPVALLGALERLGVGELREVKLMRRLSGIDPFNPTVLSAPGIDVAAPMWLSFEPAGLDYVHVRLAFVLADKAAFANFLDGVAASRRIELKRVPETSALGKEGVVATGGMATYLGLVVRRKGDVVTVDLLHAPAGKKVPTPAELSRRFPWSPLKPFSSSRGARRLFVPEAAAVFYVDGRRLYPLLASMQRDRPTGKGCAVWARAPSTFDDVALAVAATPEGTSLDLAWGTQAGAPLGGLKFATVDDLGSYAESLARVAPASFALYASGQAILKLKRAAPYTSLNELDKAVNECGALGTVGWVRAWPLMAAAWLTSPSVNLDAPARGLRNLVLSWRDFSESSSAVLRATFSPDARAAVQRVIDKQMDDGRRLFSELGNPPADPVVLNVADSRKSFDWAVQASVSVSGKRDSIPLADVAADMAQLAKVFPRLGLSHELSDMLARLRRVDGNVVADGDLLRLSLHSPLKQ